MLVLRAAGAALAAGAAAWLSQGSLGFATADGGRIGLLPLSLPAFALILLAAAAVFVMAWRGASLAPLLLLVLVVVPWLPIPLPAVALMWASRMSLFVWGAVLLAMWASFDSAPSGPRSGQAAAGARAILPFRAHSAAAAGAIALVVYAFAAWHASPMRPGGDEPHYLVITQSLLLDRDLRIENNHRRGDYRAYFRGELPPDFVQRGRDGQIYSIHAPGISAVVAPAFALGGYPAVVVMLVCLAAAGSALAWHLAWIVTGRKDAAWFGWAAATLSTTAIFQSFAVYPDGLGALLVLTGVWALVRAGAEARDGTDHGATRFNTGHWLPWLLQGAALSLLPWLHTRFAVLAGTIGALVLLRLSATREPAAKAVAFLAIPAVAALAWVAYFIAIYGTPDPSAPYGSSDLGSLAFVPSGVTGILFDQRFGVLAYTPALAFAFGGLLGMLRRTEHGRLALELLFIVIPYVLTFSSYAMWWGGASAPARFLMPVVPLLAIPAAAAWSFIRRRATKATAAGALAFSLIAAAIVVLAGNGRLAYNGRDGFAHWLEWLAPSIELVQGVPVWFRAGEPVFFRRAGDLIYARDIAIWAAALIGAWLLVRRIESLPRLRGRGALAAAAGGAFASAAMVATAIVWMLHGATGIAATEAQFDLLQRISREPRFVAFHLEPPSRIDAARLAGAMGIETARSAAQGCAGRLDRPLFSLPGLPAGRYRLRVRAQAASGVLLVGVGCDQFTLVTQTLTAPPQPIEIDFPVDLRRLLVRGDEDARQTARTLIVEPLSIVPAASRLSDGSARHGVRYGDAAAYFLDEGLFAEPEAFWVRGGRRGTLVLKPDVQRTAATLFLRNAPVENRLTIETGTWRDEMTLAPGEERRVQVPLDASRGATLVTFTAANGFRPSEVDPKSRDGRLLGVWVKIE
jgi:hypothetical protein